PKDLKHVMYWSNLMTLPRSLLTSKVRTPSLNHNTLNQNQPRPSKVPLNLTQNTIMTKQMTVNPRMHGSYGQVSSLNLPNVLTSIRIALVPFFIWALWASGTFGQDSMMARWIAVAIFAAAMYTDKLDGDIAR